MAPRYKLLGDDEDEYQGPTPSLSLDMPDPISGQAPKSSSYDDYIRLRGQLGSGPKPEPYVPHEYSPDMTGGIGSALAVGLDAIMNKGRGAGKILGAAAGGLADANSRADQMNQREREMALQQDRALAGKTNPLDQYMEYMRARNGEQQAVTSAGNLGQRQITTARAGDMDFVHDTAKSRSEGSAEGRIGKTTEMLDQVVDQKRQQSAASAQGIEDTKEANQSQDLKRKVNEATALAPILANRAGLTAEAVAPTQIRVARIKDDNATEEDIDRQGKLREESSSPLALAQTSKIADAKHSDEGQIAGAGKTRTANAAKYRKDNENNADFGSALQTIEGTLAKYGEDEDIPGIGPGDSIQLDPQTNKYIRYLGNQASPLDDDTMTRSVAHMNARMALKKAITGLASTDKEDLNIANMIGDPATDEKTYRNAIRYWSEKTKKKIKAGIIGYEDVGPEILQELGIKDWAGVQSPQPQAAAPMGSGGGMEGAEADDEDTVIVQIGKESQSIPRSKLADFEANATEQKLKYRIFQ